VIVLETSALVAILLAEPDRPRLLKVLTAADRVLVCAFSRYEAQVVLWGKRVFQHPAAEVDGLLDQILAQVVPFDAAQATLAFEAYARFGKGSGSKARLNLADCAAYALARHANAPLLFTGDDFAHTDVVAA
jgi:ribonuclease VapC